MNANETRKELRGILMNDGAGKRVYVCSKYGTRGNKETNLELAKMFCMCLIEGGYTPICPHVFYHEVLNDEVPSQRAAGLELGLHLLEDCDVLLVCSGISEGMKAEIKRAWELEIPVEIMDMSVIYGEDQAAAVHEAIRGELEALYGKEHHTEAYR